MTTTYVVTYKCSLCGLTMLKDKHWEHVNGQCSDIQSLLHAREAATYLAAAALCEAEITCEDTSSCQFAVCECAAPKKLAAALRAKATT